MNYPELTKDQLAKIKECFYIYDYSEFQLLVEITEKGYYLSLSQPYQHVEFKKSTLTTYLEIASILSCTNGDEVARDSYRGCPTCDYGSSYIIKLRFWKD